MAVTVNCQGREQIIVWYKEFSGDAQDKDEWILRIKGATG